MKEMRWGVGSGMCGVGGAFHGGIGGRSVEEERLARRGKFSRTGGLGLGLGSAAAAGGDGSRECAPGGCGLGNRTLHPWSRWK